MQDGGSEQPSCAIFFVRYTFNKLYRKSCLSLIRKNLCDLHHKGSNNKNMFYIKMSNLKSYPSYSNAVLYIALNETALNT